MDRKTYQEHLHQCRPPYIILDSSFVFGGILENKVLIAPEFFTRCSYLKDISYGKVRILNPIKREIEHKITPYLEDPYVQKGIRQLQLIHTYPMQSRIEEMHLFEFFTEKMAIIGERLPRSHYKEGLSLVDIRYGAYNLLKTLKSDVISATRDNLLIQTMEKVYEIMHPTIVARGYPNKQIFIARDIEELESRLSEIKTIRRERELRYLAHTSKIKNYSDVEQVEF